MISYTIENKVIIYFFPSLSLSFLNVSFIKHEILSNYIIPKHPCKNPNHIHIYKPYTLPSYYDDLCVWTSHRGFRIINGNNENTLLLFNNFLHIISYSLRLWLPVVLQLHWNFPPFCTVFTLTSVCSKKDYEMYYIRQRSPLKITVFESVTQHTIVQALRKSIPLYSGSVEFKNLKGKTSLSFSFPVTANLVCFCTWSWKRVMLHEYNIFQQRAGQNKASILSNFLVAFSVN